MTSHDLESALRATLSSPMTASQRAALESRLRVRTMAPATTARAARARPPARRLGLLAAAMLVLAGGVVTGTLYLTESPHGLSSAKAFQAEIDSAKAVVPIPPGSTWPPYLAARDGYYSTGGGRIWVETVAFCLWSGSWLEAMSAGDEAAAESAAKTIAAVPTWEGHRSEFQSTSARAHLAGVIAAVGSGDTATVRRDWALNCQP